MKQKSNSILQSLKKIYTKMTGKPVIKRKTETDVLSDIAEAYEPIPNDGNHLYRYDIYMHFADINEDEYTLTFNILLNRLVELTDDNIKEFLYTNYLNKNISGLFNKYGSSDYYGIFEIEGDSVDSMYFNFNSGDSSTDEFNVTSIQLDYTKTKLF